MSWRFVLLFGAVACTASESERATRIADRRQAREALLTADVVQTSKTPTTAGRLIYEPPADLSYDSLRVKRPDLLSPRDRATR
jgi:hypothetical protein